MKSGAAGVLVVFAKEPRPGRVKTRMCPPLDADEACELYAHMLDDVLAASASFASRLGLEPVLAVHPPTAVPFLARVAPTPFRVIRQRGASLGERMTWAVREAAAAGATRILLRGSDSPALDAKLVAAALEALAGADLVVSPDRDGGYGLVGLRGPAPSLFDHPMSTRTVLEDTLANARACGLRAHALPECFDLDTVEDLRWLQRVRSPAVERLCPRTLEFLDFQNLWRFSSSG